MKSRKKIIITGGLGYIGTELCRLYSKEGKKNKVIVFDKRFLSERVNQLKKWNINFYQGDILDKIYLKKILKNCNIVHHLAGITDVAYVKKESDPARDNNTKRVAIEGTRNVIKSVSKKCKIIFPSSHVIFEGFKNIRKNVSEEEKPCPFLAYSTGKLQNENDIIKSGNNFIILRLGSVYGYSSDSTRLSIMPNLFSKITSLNGTIKLFGGGKQLKSLVPLVDVARCFKYMADSKNINNEIFNVTKDSTTVKDIALICKKKNSKVQLKTTKDETPNLGYTLSNKKLLNTGFRFSRNLKDAISEMIDKWTTYK